METKDRRRGGFALGRRYVVPRTGPPPDPAMVAAVEKYLLALKSGLWRPPHLRLVPSLPPEDAPDSPEEL